ncbi:MAG: DUF2007 domain-containing protein [Desulfobacteraceae bacterium]|nr:DUF2007 domain-containing protein [Desulfobacteraceae bacterium]
MEEKLVTVAVFGAPYEAEMAKGELEANGIPAFILDQFTIGANPLYSNALGGIKLQVLVSYAEDAQRIISAQVPQEETEPIKPESNPKKAIAKTFVWFYLAMAAGGLFFLVYVFSKL